MKITSSLMLVPALLGAGMLAQANANHVQAKGSYKVQVTKKAYAYTAKGKKTKTVYQKNKVATAYRIKKIKGKYYYDLGHGKYIRTSSAKKYWLKKSTQTKKIVRTIKLYQPNSVETQTQTAYVKRSVTKNMATKKSTYGKWRTSSWEAFKVPAVSGYTASVQTIASEKVYSWTKSKTVKVQYKKNASENTAQKTTDSKNKR